MSKWYVSTAYSHAQALLVAVNVYLSSLHFDLRDTHFVLLSIVIALCITQPEHTHTKALSTKP